jgi:hypothetical protein
MEDCACVDFNNRCDEHKDLVIGENLIGGGFDPWSSGAMEALPNGVTESTPITETDAMGREKFWEDIGRKDD